MKNYWKSYHVFLSGTLIRVVLYVLYPIFVSGWCIFLGNLMVFSKQADIVSLVMAVSLIIMAELFLDTYVYGGILSKNTNKLEFLKTSYKGIKVLNMSLLVDKIRRIIAIALILGLTYIVCNSIISIGQLIGVIFVVGTVIELSLLITRYMQTLTWIILVMMLANMLGCAVGALAMFLPSGFVIVFLMMFMAIEIGSNKLIMKKAEDSYYDVRVEKML